MDGEAVVRFRVGRNMRKAVVTVLAEEPGQEPRTLLRRKRPVMAPGEMEQIALKKEWLTGDETKITVEAREEDA